MCSNALWLIVLRAALLGRPLRCWCRLHHLLLRQRTACLPWLRSRFGAIAVCCAPQVSTKGWEQHPEFAQRCIAKLQSLVQKKRAAAAPKKVRLGSRSGVEAGLMPGARWWTRGVAGGVACSGGGSGV